MADDLVLVGLVLVFLQEIRSTGEGDLVDVLLYFIRSHAQAGIYEFQGFFFGIYHDPDAVLKIVRVGIFAHQLQLFQLGDGVAAVGDQLPEKNVMVGIEPFFNNRKNIFAVDGKTSVHVSHFAFTPLSLFGLYFF